MKAPRILKHAARRAGFTLLEMLVAVTILAMVFTVVWRTFDTVLSGFNRGQKFLENLHHGDYVVEQLTSALRSSVFYDSRKDKYGFWLNDKGGNDRISWVTASSAFMGPHSPNRDTLHRIEILIDDDKKGDPSFTVRAWPHMAEEDDRETEPEEWHISSKIIGLQCEVYDPEVKDWENKWENTNSVPRLVKLTLTMKPVDEGDREPEMSISRVVEIPVAPELGSAPSAEASSGTPSSGAQTPTLTPVQTAPPTSTPPASPSNRTTPIMPKPGGLP